RRKEPAPSGAALEAEVYPQRYFSRSIRPPSRSHPRTINHFWAHGLALAVRGHLFCTRMEFWRGTTAIYSRIEFWRGTDLYHRKYNRIEPDGVLAKYRSFACDYCAKPVRRRRSANRGSLRSGSRQGSILRF